MQQLGHFSLCLAWILALLGMGLGIWGGVRRSTRWLHSTINSTILTSVSVSLAIFALGYSFINNDYTNQYVWQFSNREMPWIYKISAIWGGMDGSMLLWCFMLAISSAVLAARCSSYKTTIMPWVLAVLNSSLFFFLTIVVFLTNPFRYLKAPFVPLDGNGLNPLLQNEYMAIHPPSLYVGFTMLAVPYAFCMGALLAGDLSNEWIRLTRRWTLVAWAFLSVGITLGGYWAYIELGWGGFWAWDPVENASFLPWLTATAFLHSVMVQERRDMLKMWNVWLIVLTYGLTVFGTFLTRSGVVQSVHAFASTNIGWVFLLYLGIIFGIALVLTIVRRADLKAARSIVSFLSREAFFLINNLLFLGICFTVIWGVLFPLVSEKFTGQKQTVGPPFFNAVTMPMFLALLFLMGVGPLIAWQKAGWKNIQRTFLMPFASAVVVAALLVARGVSSFMATLAYALGWFVSMTIIGEIRRGVRAQRSESGGSVANSAAVLLRRHHVRYGGYLIHFGVVIAAIGITASMTHKTEKDFTLSTGEHFEVGRFNLTLDSLADRSTPNYQAVAARVGLALVADGQKVTTLAPEMRRYRRNDEPTSEVAINTSWREDVYLVLAGIDEEGKRASFKLFINPLQVWLWIGVMVMIVGVVIVIFPKPAYVERH